jgi:hypothetical protein
VGVLVVGARPEFTSSVVPLANLMQADLDAGAVRDEKLMGALTFDDEWFDQSPPVADLKIDHEVGLHKLL